MWRLKESVILHIIGLGNRLTFANPLPEPVMFFLLTLIKFQTHLLCVYLCDAMPIWPDVLA